MNATPAPATTAPTPAVIPTLPGSVPVFGVLPQLQRDALGTMEKATHGFERLVRLPLPFNDGFILSDPKLIDHVLVGNPRNYLKQTRGYQMLRLLLGNGLVTSEGDFWKRQRRIAQPAFHRERLAAFGDTMTRGASEMVDGWTMGQPFDVATAFMQVTLRLVGETLLSSDVTAATSQVGSAITVALEHLIHRTLHPFGLPEWAPTPRNRGFLRAKRTLDDVVLKMIADRRQGKGPTTDLLAMLMEARDPETGEGMTDEQLRDEVMTIFLAGHETTANALAWTMVLLGKSPQVEQRLVKELSDVLGGRAPTMSDVPKLQYTAMVLKESMRLFPPVWSLARRSVDEEVVDGVVIPKNAYLFICTYALHRHAKYWKDPEAFDPDRWAPDAPPPQKGTYFPFSMGQRKCIGDTFAMVEAQLILATMLQRVHLSLVPGQSFEPEPLVTLRPKFGVMMVPSKR